MKTFTKTWATAHIDLWTQILAEFKGVPNVRALEIGSFEGRSACWFIDHILTGDGASLTCVDTWAGFQDAEKLFDQNTSEYQNRIRKFKASSIGFLARRIGEGKRATQDFIYIDGDHRAHAVLEDAVLTWPLLKSGGIVFFDDCGEEFKRLRENKHILPRVAVESFLSCRPNDYKILHNEDQIIVRKL